MNTAHLIALQARLAHERTRFTADNNDLRRVWIAQIEREIANEKALIGLTDELPEMTDDELLAALDA